MGATTVEVADGVALELETIDDEGRRRFGLWSGSGLIFVLVFGGLQVLGLGIAENENETSAVRRPFEVVNTLGGVGEVSGFAAKTVEKPDLGFAIVSRGEEGEIFAIGAPARMRGGDAFGGHGNGIAAVGRNHPEALLVLIFLEHAGAHGIGDPLTIGTQFGL